MFAICQICHEIPRNSIYYPKLTPGISSIRRSLFRSVGFDKTARAGSHKASNLFPKKYPALCSFPHLHFGWRPGIQSGHILCMANDFLMACANVSWSWGRCIKRVWGKWLGSSRWTSTGLSFTPGWLVPARSLKSLSLSPLYLYCVSLQSGNYQFAFRAVRALCNLNWTQKRNGLGKCGEQL